MQGLELVEDLPNSWTNGCLGKQLPLQVLLEFPHIFGMLKGWNAIFI